MRRQVFLALAAAGGALVGFPTLAQAQTPGFAVDRLDPAERGSEWFTTESLDIRGHGQVNGGALMAYAGRQIFFTAPNGDKGNSILRNQLLVHPGFTFTLWDRLRLGVSVPVQIYADGKSQTINGVVYGGPADQVSAGDVRMGADVRLFGVPKDGLTVAFGTQIHLPSGSAANFTSDGLARIAPRLLAAGEIGDFLYAARFGVQYRGRDGVWADGKLGSELSWGASFGMRLFDKRLLVGPEIFGSAVLSDFPSTRPVPVEALLGARYRWSDTIRSSFGVGVGLTEGLGVPVARALFGLEWTPGSPPPDVPEKVDADKDGVDDSADACPKIPGVATADPKTNGCPPPPPDDDPDKDGVRGAGDLCPNVTGFGPKHDGCPSDRDGDGIPDCEDACPFVSGVKADEARRHGCPGDSDGDGVDDATDACPKEPGVKTLDPKTNGCPDRDLDKDGVSNDADACPNEAGPADPDPKRNGCPKAFVSGAEIKILDQVKFKTGSAEILPGKDSEEVLQAVLKVLTSHPEIKRVRVEGHTDDRGQAATNRKLSGDRAASVVKWLTGKGIDKGRLTSQGFGPDRPLEPNTTDAARAANRRVEFHIEKDQ